MSETSETEMAELGRVPAIVDATGYRCLVFSLDDIQYGLPLAAVERVVRVVEITPLPKAPAIILGVINMQGRIIPVADVRARFGRPERSLRLTDQLIIAHTEERPMALLVDRVGAVLTLAAADIIPSDEILPHIDFVAGVVKLPDGTLFIHDLDRFLSLEETTALAAASVARREEEDAP